MVAAGSTRRWAGSPPGRWSPRSTRDRLYPVAESERLAAGIRTADPLVVIPSDHGHDGFLIEVDAVGKLVAELLDAW